MLNIMRHKAYLLLYTCVVMTLMCSNTFALNVQQFTRSNSLTFEMLDDARTRNSHVHNDYDLMLTLGVSFVDTPLVVKNAENSIQLDTIVDDMIGLHWGASFYFKPWFQLSATGSYSRFHNIHDKYSSGFTDIEVKGKFRLLSEETYALSIAPTISIPTGQGESVITDSSFVDFGTHNILSNDSFGFGGRIVFEYLFHWLQIVTNIGYMTSPDAKLTSPSGTTHIDMSQQLYTGFGVYFPVIDTLGVNIEWVRLWSNPIFKSDVNPNELYIGTSFGIYDRYHGFAGVGLGNIADIADGNDYRVIAGVKYAPLLAESKKNRSSVVLIPESFQTNDCEDRFIFDGSNSIVVRYPNDVGELDQAAKERVYEIISKINYKKQIIESVTIVGHTSATGNNEYNKMLSKKRVNSIKEILVKHSINANLIYTIGMGNSEPLEDGNTEYAHTRNRRTEFHVQLQKKFTECQ